MTRQKHHKHIVRWEKHCKTKRKIIDRKCSKEPLCDRQMFKETVDWIAHEKGRTKGYPSLKSTKVNINTLKKQIFNAGVIERQKKNLKKKQENMPSLFTI